MKDIQNLQDNRGVEIQKVGVKDLEFPLVIQRKNKDNQEVFANVKMSVSLPSHYKGTHMSRFVECLNDWKNCNLLGIDIESCTKDLAKNLDAKSSYIKFKFRYFIDKKSPVSEISSPMCYECSFEGILDNYNTDEEKYKFVLGVKVPVTTLCPCSKEISEYGAHNQRAIVSVKVSYDNDKHIWIEDLVDMIENSASSSLYSLLKREDEKFVTELAYNNPKFVEDVLRDVVILLRENKIVNSFEVECESIESIHNHSAWAYQKESLV